MYRYMEKYRFPEGREVGEAEKKRIKKMQTFWYKISHQDIMYSISNRVNNIVKTLYSEIWLLDFEVITCKVYRC